MKRACVFVPVSVLVLLAACSGGSGSTPSSTLPQDAMVIPMTSTPTPMPAIHIEPDEVNGLENQFIPNDGDTAAGARGSTIDGIPCAPTMVENKYHVHFFLGVMVNGKEIALPDAIGMYLPGTETNGWTNSAHCYYALHTHDASGLVHIESPSTVPLKYSIANLGEFLDIWGEPLTATRFGPYYGTVRIFYATTNLGNVNGGSYYPYTGTTPRSIALHSHEAIWIEVGSTYVPASRLPKIVFYTQF